MSPLQLTAKRGMRMMFQHIMRKELTKVLWVWGPVTQYQLSLEGIDSSGHGASDVMEILTREDADVQTQEFLLDDFMSGFLFTLFQQKWAKFGWYMHVAMRALDFAVVLASIMLCITLKNEGETKSEGHSHEKSKGVTWPHAMVVVWLPAWLAFLWILLFTPGEDGAQPGRRAPPSSGVELQPYESKEEGWGRRARVSSEERVVQGVLVEQGEERVSPAGSGSSPCVVQ